MSSSVDALLPTLKRTWGYDGFRPLQAEAIECVLAGRDSLVVLPTGGGKSLCFQAPALHMPGLAVVVSPLIALMDDQVAALRECGVGAATVNSTSSAQERIQIAKEAREGRLKLMYLSPERLMSERMLAFLKTIELSFIAIDEAHCISAWGHDFRPEYRMLNQLKALFDDLPVHAYTATATEPVRDDIARQLGLVGHRTLVGSFDRPNLIYRARRRRDLVEQIDSTLNRRPGESGIVYCIRRKDVDSVCAELVARGHSAVPYHAGMSDEDRRHNQTAFLNDEAKIVVATIAFGMGIDKSNVRFVIHAGAPKSVENYQQEAGRAGRDGLEAECWLFWGGDDFFTWRHLQNGLPAAAKQASETSLAAIERFCSSPTCRHKALVEHFGQAWEGDPAGCGACDVCLEELEQVPDTEVVAQKILSCVVRVGESFGGQYVSQVLVGSREKRILDKGHDRLSVHGLLKNHDQREVREWVEQLVGQGYLQKTGDYDVLCLTPSGRALLRGESQAKLLASAPPSKKGKQAKVETDAWEGVDRGLFDSLKGVRKTLAAREGVAPFMVMSDASARDIARRRPGSIVKLLDCYGIGERKAEDFGAELLEAVATYCHANGLELDPKTGRGATGAVVPRATPSVRVDAPEKKPGIETRSLARVAAARMFGERASVDDVAKAIDRAQSTVYQYLVEWIQETRTTDPTPWLSPEAQRAVNEIRDAILKQESPRLAPVHEELGGRFSYDDIKVVHACLRSGLVG